MKAFGCVYFVYTHVKYCNASKSTACNWSVKMDNVFQFKRRGISADGLQNSE